VCAKHFLQVEEYTLKRPYVVVFNVEGIEPGVYHYDDQQHCLTLIRKGEFEKQVIELLLGQFFAKGLALEFS
jgi:hypothetical protein